MSCTQRSVIGYSATYPGDYAMILLPRQWKGDGTLYPVIACHGATATPMAFTDTSQSAPSSIRLAHMFAEEFGRPVICPYMGGDQFGNTNAVTTIDDAITYASSSLGCKAGKAWLLGESMGAGNAQSYAKAHPSKVVGITGLVPLADLNDIVTNNRAGMAATVNTAAGGTYVEATNGPTMNPTNFGASLRGIPIDFWYSTDDTVVLPATVTNLLTVIGGSAAQATAISGAHGEAAIATLTAAQRQAIGVFAQTQLKAAGG